MRRLVSMSDQAVLDTAAAIEAHLAQTIEPWERRRHGVRFVLCDRANRVCADCPVDDLPVAADPADCAHAVSLFASALAGSDADGALLVALTRPGGGTVTDADRVWFHAAHAVCARLGVRLIGVHLLTPTRQRPILLDDAL
jgi:hypothetical protein